MKWLIGFLVCLQSLTAFANQTLNVYAWSDYIPDAVVKQFEQQTHITVHLSVYDSNETLYAKLKASPHAGYDVIIPSSYYVDRLSKEHRLLAFHPNRLTGFQALNPTLLHQPFDPHNTYSMPYLWGATGIVVNTQYWNPTKIQTWKDLWAPRFKNQLLLLNDYREVFSIALMRLGYSINTRNPKKIKQAYQLLKKLNRNVKLYNSDAQVNTYIDEDATIGIGWNGDVSLAQRENRHLAFIYPRQHYALWVDCLAIPKNAPHVNNAIRFIQFILQPRIAKEIALYTGYSSPNTIAMKQLPLVIQHNPAVNPPARVLKRGVFQLDVGNANVVYERYWELLKLGAD